MPPEAQPRVPFAPLRRFGSNRSLYVQAGVAQRCCVRWASEGIPIYKADQIANALGLHPAEIWHDDWWRATA